MVRRIVVMVAAWGVICSSTAWAKGWEAPAWNARLQAMHDSDLFPGSALSSSDRGVEGAIVGGTARRLGKKAKLALEVEAGGQRWNRFDEASYGWLRGMTSVRAGQTTFRVDTEWTPSRLKFPAVLEGGSFERLETRAGIRQALGANWRARAEWRHQRDDFVTTYDVRDANTNEGFGQLMLRASPRWSLRGEALVGSTETSSRKYAHEDRVVGGAVTYAPAAWRFDLGAWSGLSRYRDAIVGDSNFRRRDQTVEIRAEVQRTLASGISLQVGAALFDQNSSRADRTYTTHDLRLGLAWARSANP